MKLHGRKPCYRLASSRREDSLGMRTACVVVFVVGVALCLGVFWIGGLERGRGGFVLVEEEYFGVRGTKPVDCGEGKALFRKTSREEIRFVKERWRGKEERLNCCYRTVRRRAVAGKIPDYGYEVSVRCWALSMDRPVRIRSEFVNVQCREGGKKLVYDDFFAFVRPAANATGGARTTEGLSVSIVGLDSVSRAHLHRSMPRTVEVLEGMDAVELRRHNRVGLNTFPNLVPLLTGGTVGELRRSCWANDSVPFDDCHFLWDDFRRHGYSTAYGEDWPSFGTFVYNRAGFAKKPTDYYPMPAFVAAREKSGEYSGSCFGHRRQIDVLLDYAVDLTTSLRSRRYFGVFWSSSATHDAMENAYWLDEIVSSFLARMDLNSTVLVFASDHGIRTGEYRERTDAGRMEENLPFAFFVLPERFRRDRPDAMRILSINGRRLTTHFDIHRTLASLLPESPNDAGKGRDLFASELSPSRSCEEAGIPVEYCVSWVSRPAENADLATRIARVVVDHMNRQTLRFPQCARLVPNRVGALSCLQPPSAKNASVDHYLLSLNTSPGGGAFEAHVTVTSSGSASGQERLVVTALSRVNRYGNQSHCVNKSELKEICFCLR